MSTTTREGYATALPRPTRDAVVWVWALASFFAFVGDSVWLVGLAWAAVTVATPAVAGVVVAIGMAPQAVLLLVGGSVADRLSTRAVLIGANAVRVATLLLGAALWQRDVPAVPLLITLACVFGAADAFYLPATSTMPRQMVRAEDLATLGGLFQVVRRAGVFIGSALGGWIAAAHGLATAMVVDAIGFLVVTLVIAAVLRPRFPLPRNAGEPVLRAIRSGLAYVRGDQTVRTFVLTLSGLNVFVGPALALGVALRADTSGWGAGVVGAANACVGAGAAVGALAAMRLRPDRPAMSRIPLPDRPGRRHRRARAPVAARDDRWRPGHRRHRRLGVGADLGVVPARRPGRPAGPRLVPDDALRLQPAAARDAALRLAGRDHLGEHHLGLVRRRDGPDGRLGGQPPGHPGVARPDHSKTLRRGSR